MTDLELTKACAEAMGVVTAPIRSPEGEEWIAAALPGGNPWLRYDPLHDDAQAMALVKKFQLGIFPYNDGCWDVRFYGEDGDVHASATHKPNLNRAICECVANMRKAK